MSKHKRRPPDLLEVTRADGTLVMDCNSGIALLSVPPKSREPAAGGPRAATTGEEQSAETPKSKLTRN